MFFILLSDQLNFNTILLHAVTSCTIVIIFDNLLYDAYLDYKHLSHPS